MRRGAPGCAQAALDAANTEMKIAKQNTNFPHPRSALIEPLPRCAPAAIVIEQDPIWVRIPCLSGTKGSERFIDGECD